MDNKVELMREIKRIDILTVAREEAAWCEKWHLANGHNGLCRLAKAVIDLSAALTVYADATNWKCPRCGKKDEHNCFMGSWCGPVGARDEHEYGTGDHHGWTIARAALDGKDLGGLKGGGDAKRS